MILHEMVRQLVYHDRIDDLRRKMNQNPVESQQVLYIIILSHARAHIRDFDVVTHGDIHALAMLFDARSKNIQCQRLDLPIQILLVDDDKVLFGNALLPQRKIDQTPPNPQNIDICVGHKRRRMQSVDLLFVEYLRQHFRRRFQGIPFFQGQIEMSSRDVDFSSGTIGRFDIQNDLFSVKRNYFRFFHLNHRARNYIIVREKKNQIRRKIMEKILISYCLLGKNCKWNGRSNYSEKIAALSEKYELIPICPEVFGGLPTPRIPSEIVGDRVYNQIFLDVTDRYIEGAKEALRIAEKFQVRYAILKERSPSCGVHRVYDGQFQRKTIEGMGIAARLLKENGIEVFSDEEIEEKIARFDDHR